MQALHLQPLLAACRLFYRLRHEQLARITAFAFVRWYEPGETLAVQGVPAKSIQILLSGSARATVPGWGAHGERLTIGNVAGWCGLVDPFVYDSTITADEACIALHIDVNELRRYMDSDPAVCFAVMSGVAELMLETYARMSEPHDIVGCSTAGCSATEQRA